MIQFVEVSKNWVSVRIGTKKVGEIKPSRGGGFHYAPANSKLRGETFKTIEAVKASVRGDDDT